MKKLNKKRYLMAMAAGLVGVRPRRVQPDQQVTATFQVFDEPVREEDELVTVTFEVSNELVSEDDEFVTVTFEINDEQDDELVTVLFEEGNP